MKILEISKYFPPEYGGIETHVYHLSLGLSQLGHKVTVLCATKNKNKIETVKNVLVIRFKEIGKVFNAPVVFGQLLRTAQSDCNVIHIHFPNPLGELAALLISSTKKKKVVVTYHNDVIPQNNFQSFLLYFYEHVITLPLLKRANAIIVHSPHYVNESSLLKKFKSKVRIVPSGVDIKRFRPNLNVQNIKKGYGEDYKLIMFAGRLVQYKGIKYLIKAMPYILKKVPKSKLLIVGKGPLKSNLILQVQRLGLQDNITFIGNLNDQEYPLYMGACDVLVLPSVSRQEGFGLTLLEAMACSKPVVGSKISAIPYIIDDGMSGLLAEPANPIDIAEKICKIITNESLAKKLGDNGRKKVEKHFEWSVIYCQVDELLRGLRS